MSDRRLNSPQALASLAGRRYASDLAGRVDEDTRRTVERLVAAAYRSGYWTGQARALRMEPRKDSKFDNHAEPLITRTRTAEAGGQPGSRIASGRKGEDRRG